MNPTPLRPRSILPWPEDEDYDEERQLFCEASLRLHGTELLNRLIKFVKFDINAKLTTRNGTILAFVIDEMPERKDMIDMLIREGGIYESIRPLPLFQDKAIQNTLNDMRLLFLKETIMTLGFGFHSANLPTLVLLEILDFIAPLALMFSMKTKWDLIVRIKHWRSIKPPSPS